MTKVEITEDGMIYLPATGTRLNKDQAVELHKNLGDKLEEMEAITGAKHSPGEE